MSPVHKLSAMGSITTNKIDYPSMLAGYGDFGALQRIRVAFPAGTNAVTFDNIPQNFQDLVVVVYGLDAATGGVSGYSIGVNNTYTGLASDTTLEGNGASAYSSRSSANNGWAITGFPGATNIFGSSTVHILNYANTSTFKTSIARYAADRNGSGVTGLRVSLFRSTAAITRLDFFPYSGNYGTGTIFALYGVRASAA